MRSKEKIIGTTDKILIYEEKAPFTRRMRLLMVLLLSLLALSIVFAFFGNYFGAEYAPFEVQFILVLVVLISDFAVWSFFKMKFRITGTGIEAVMPPFTYRVRFSDIKEASITNIPWYVGWGLRIWGRRLVFVSMHKKAVKIEKQSGIFRALVLTVRDPDEFIRIVRETRVRTS